MEEQPVTWTMDDSTRASSPGGIRVSRLLWLRHYPKWPFLWAASLIVMVVLAWMVHWVFWIPAGLLLGMNFLYWKRIQEHFLHGCVNASVVVSLDPMWIAVATDLSKGIGDYPAIKIIHKELSRIGGQQPQVGSRLPTVALYASDGKDETPHWVDFDPRPAQCATSDDRELQRLMDSIDSEDWDDLDARLGEIPRPYHVGLYRLWESSGDPASGSSSR